VGVHAGRRGECARYGYPHWYARFCVATRPSVNLTCCHGQRNTRRRRIDDTRRAPKQTSSTNTGHRARNPGVLWLQTRARARVLEYGCLSSYAQFRIRRVAHLATDGPANTGTLPPAGRRSSFARPLPRGRGRVSGLSPRDGKGGGIPVGVRIGPLVQRNAEGNAVVRKTRNEKGRGKTWELLGAIPLGAGPLAPNSSQVFPRVRDG